MKAVFLDIGGVVLKIDWNNVDPRPEAIKRLQSWETFHRFETGDVDSEEFFSGLSDIMGVVKPASEWRDAWMSLLVGELPEVHRIFDALRGVVPVYALSNTNPVHCHYQFSQFPAMSRFDRVFTSFELRARKPGLEIYEKAARIAGVQPGDCLFVDDSMENVLGARQAGFTSERTENSVADTLRFLQKHLPLTI